MNRIWPLLLIAASALAQPKPPIAEQLTFAPYNASGIYKTGETVGWIVKTVQAAPSYSYKWTARRNNAIVLKEGMIDLYSGEDAIEVVAGEPEMIYVAIQAVGDKPTGGNTGRDNGLRRPQTKRASR